MHERRPHAREAGAPSRSRAGTLVLAATLVAASAAAPRAPQTAADATADPAPAARVVTSNGGRYVLHVTPPAGGFARGESLAFDVRIERARPAEGSLERVRLVVDADMPEHLHGVNRAPRATRRADGTFRVENLYLHMPGWWEIYLDVAESPWTERAQLRLDLE